MTKRGLVRVTHDTDVAGWSGGGPEAVQGIKESATRIQKAATAVLRIFEVEEPTVEVANERALVKDAARRESSSAAAEQSPVFSARRCRNRHNGVR